MASRKSRVPTTRLGRLARMGFAAGEFAIEGLSESARRIGAPVPKDAVNALLTGAGATKLAKRLAGMRGAAMKMGQMLSMEGPSILPPEFAEALAILRDSADTMPHKQLRGVMGREYGKGWEERFDSFDYEPIASASIGQVHRVQTRDGRDLALKIQYPGVARSIDSDVDNMSMMLRLLNILPVDLDVDEIVDEAKRQLRQEADYEQEARFLRDYRGRVRDNPVLRVPKVHEDLTTRRILAMDFVEGEPLEVLGEEGFDQETRDRVGRELERLLFRELFEFRLMQTDPNFANYLYQPQEGRIVLLDFGSTVNFESAFTERFRRITRALVEDDYDAIWRHAEAIGYLQPGDSPAYCGRVIELIRIICEPIREDQVYDFASSDVAVRARDAGLQLAMKSGGELRSPPPETVFLHRKLVGSFLLCSRIRARLNAQEILKEFL
ncbi:MAG: AarF/ABC1/UbiB kinase family protein [Xanthomonadales bacterium]|nr:AarF/ABC1/UbiB kinase family protein [Gammaproteobacteria bacterium]MBT8050847.1 AarF/ABC1/UbiB kinase family protein [Gammaproteobacteria bacterium]MBT8057747.1 AarF/ABC1/UbiB kinase family protein [Gammaproteobacteria bacterium]NNJ80485.1 AarF/ABC1/UbiB kinase family protein [Xanthomonadales bacterium]NNL04798.1 AarF/ABC1/UbiB kinase family protein [Xanthomonadales bacterium]